MGIDQRGDGSAVVIVILGDNRPVADRGGALDHFDVVDGARNARWTTMHVGVDHSDEQALDERFIDDILWSAVHRRTPH
jgi:hypothetical protein